MLLGRSANGDERIYFRANIDGRGEDDLTRSDGDFGCAVIDDVMGLFVLAFLAASVTSTKGEAFGLAATGSAWLQQKLAPAASHPLLVQMAAISICVTVFFVVGYGAASAGWTQ